MNKVNTNIFRTGTVIAAVCGITMIIMGLLPAFPWYVFIPIGELLLFISMWVNDKRRKKYAYAFESMNEIEKALEKENRQRKDKNWLKTVSIDETTNTEQIVIDMIGPAYNLYGEFYEHIEILNKGETEKNEIILKKLCAKWNDIFERKDFFEGITPKTYEWIEPNWWRLENIFLHETNGTLPDGRFIKTIGRPFVWNEIALIIKYKRLEIRKMHMEYKTKDNKVLSIDIKKIEFGAVIVLSFISDESTIKMHIYITPHGAPSLPDLREPDIIDAQINVKLPKNKANAERVTLNDIFTKLGIEKFWEKVENFVMKLDDAYQAPQKRAAYQDPQERKEYIQKQKEDMQKQKEDSKEKVQADMEKLNKALSEIDNI